MSTIISRETSRGSSPRTLKRSPPTCRLFFLVVGLGLELLLLLLLLLSRKLRLLLRFFLFRELQPALRQVDKDRAVINKGDAMREV